MSHSEADQVDFGDGGKRRKAVVGLMLRYVEGRLHGLMEGIGRWMVTDVPLRGASKLGARKTWDSPRPASMV